MAVTVGHIWRYPVKGLSAEELPRVTLEPGRPLPHDRRFALARAAARISADDGAWRPKDSFLMLRRDERLARLQTRFDDAACRLTICRDGRQVARDTIDGAPGRARIAAFIAAFLRLDAGATPVLVEAADGAFCDVPEALVSVISLASVADLSRVLGTAVDPRRFRANIALAGAGPWQERGWVGAELALGDVRLAVVDHIGRCAATDVNPATGARDLNIPKTLVDAFGHHCMGVYARVTRGGSIAAGDPVAVAGG